MNKLSASLALALSLTLAVTGCKKKEEPVVAPVAGSAATGSAAAGSAAPDPAAGSAAPDPAAGSAAPAAGSADTAVADDKADYLKVVADHVEAGKGTVDVMFAGIKVVKADFDPAVVEGGTATVEIDVNTLSSGIAKRDGHLKNEDYLDATKYPTVTLDIANVKKSGENYTADAKINVHGVEKTYALTFAVVEATADSIRIKGEHGFSRLDFGVGKVDGDGSKPELVAHFQLTLKKS